MARQAVVNALKARGSSYAPQSSGAGRISPVAAEAYYSNPYAKTYGPFLPRPGSIFSDGAFAPMPPIQPVPVDTPPPGSLYPDPRRWQYRPSWNLPTPPGTEGLKLASFDQIKTLGEKYCLDAQTRVLCSDFAWRKLTEISVGDELIAFDEQPPERGHHRKMRTATVISCDKVIRPSYRVRFTDGREIIASAEHRWLAGRSRGVSQTAKACETCGKSFGAAQGLAVHERNSHGTAGRRKEDPAWVMTEHLQPGSKIRDLGRPWDAEISRPAGYLQGVFDGEASLHTLTGDHGSWSISFPQRPGIVFDTVGYLLKERGYHTRQSGPDKSGCMHVVVSGIYDCFRFMGEIGPYRLLENSPRWLEGRSPSRTGSATVESVEFLGNREVLAVGTTTKTLIAEGLFSHNSVARAAMEIRIEEIRALEWDIVLTTDAAKAYRNDRHMMRDFGERKAQAKKFFRHPDPEYWNFDSFLSAFLEEIFAFDALSLIFRPKFGEAFGMGGKGLLGSNLDSLMLVSGPTIRPLIGLHGETPRPPAPAYQQFLYGVPRSDYMTMATGADITEAGLAGAEVNVFDSDVMLYAPYWRRAETPYGFPPVERALLPIVSGLQKQEYQNDYFTEGTVPAVYISPGDTNISPTQIGELQTALNAIAGDPAYHQKVIVLPPLSKVDPQRPVDLSDSFDYLVMNQVLMEFDVQPTELGIIPDIGGTQQGPGASAVRFAGQQKRDIKSRVSAKPLLKWICDIFNHVLQDICDQPDMQFQFEGLVDDEDKAAITELGVQQVQNGIASIDEIRERLDMAPWGLPETSEPVLFTANGALPLGGSADLIRAAILGQAPPAGQGTNSGQQPPSRPHIRAGGQTRPNGSHPAPIAPHREPAGTPQHAAALGTIQSPTPRTGGSAARTAVAGSRKTNVTPSRRTISGKAAMYEMEALKRHLRKGRLITDWEPVNLTDRQLGMIAEDTAKGILLDLAAQRALVLKSHDDDDDDDFTEDEPHIGWVSGDDEDDDVDKAAHFPGWEHDLDLIAEYRDKISAAFADAEAKGRQLRKDAATGKMYVSAGTLQGLLSDAVGEAFSAVIAEMGTKGWNLGYESAQAMTGTSAEKDDAQLQAFLDTEGTHWQEQVSRTGLGNPAARSDMIARTEIARAVNAGAVQAYKNLGVSYKHLMTAPDDACEICLSARAEGDIPLDAIWQGGNPPLHVRCRCVAAPSGVDFVPPVVKGVREDPSRVAFVMIRGKDPEGKPRYLLQKRTDDTWGLPGGMAHIGEEPFAAAVREAREEVGDLPPLRPSAEYCQHDDDRFCSVFLCEIPEIFGPKNNGKTPEETRGTGWFRASEVGKLNLHPPFREQWETVDWKHMKSAQRVVTEMGEELVLDDPDRHGAGLGARWPYPHRADGAEVPEGSWGVQGENLEPPRRGPADRADLTNPRSYPRGGPDGEFPRERNRNAPASRFPSQETEGTWPEGGIGSDTAPGTGVPGDKAVCPCGTPVVYDEMNGWQHGDGSVSHDDGESVSDKMGNIGKSAMDDASADHRYPSPVPAHQIYLLMSTNFPPEAIQWVNRGSWTGPIEIPWERIDTDSIKEWAASKQPARVKEFERMITAHDDNIKPSVMIQDDDSPKAIIIDGHHRAIAHHNLKMPVLAYLGRINPDDRQAAEETHSKQLHSGSDPRNKGGNLGKEALGHVGDPGGRGHQAPAQAQGKAAASPKGRRSPRRP